MKLQIHCCNSQPFCADVMGLCKYSNKNKQLELECYYHALRLLVQPDRIDVNLDAHKAYLD